MDIADIIRTRWSPRAFSDHNIKDEELSLLFEAARWAPSSRNEQPWLYYYAHKEDTDQFKNFIDCLMPGNQIWAKDASVLILGTAKKEFDRNGRLNRHHMHDTGAASALLCLQANELGYQAHQMAGFVADKTYENFGIDRNRYELTSFIAVGKPGDPESLPEDLKKSEIETRQRKELHEIVKRI